MRTYREHDDDGESGTAAGGRRGPHVPFVLLVGSLVVGALALLLVLNTASAANELQRHSLSARDSAIAASVQDYRVRVAASAAPGNLARAADELGMVPGGNPAFVVIGKDGSVKVMGKPKPATEAPVPAPSTSKPKPSSSATPTRATTSPHPSGTTSRSPGASSSTKPPTTSSTKSSATATARPTPTPTPTPTVSLPGGVR